MTSPIETLKSIAAEGPAGIEKDSEALIEKQNAITEDQLEDVMLGFDIAFGVMGVTVMQGLVRIANEVVETGSCKLSMFDGLTEEQVVQVADGLARTLTAVLSNVDDNRDDFAAGVATRHLFERIEQAIAEAELESGAPVN